MHIAAVALSFSSLSPLSRPTDSIRASGSEPDVNDSTRSDPAAADPAAPAAAAGAGSADPAGVAAAGRAGGACACSWPAAAAAAAASACSAAVMSMPCCRLSRGPSYTNWRRWGSCKSSSQRAADNDHQGLIKANNLQRTPTQSTQPQHQPPYQQPPPPSIMRLPYQAHETYSKTSLTNPHSASHAPAAVCVAAAAAAPVCCCCTAHHALMLLLVAACWQPHRQREFVCGVCRRYGGYPG